MPHRKLIARLRTVAGLSERDQAKLESMPHSIKVLADGEYVVRQGDRPLSCTVVMKGLVSRQRVVADRNQITSFYVPGDMPDLHTLHLPLVDHDLCSVGTSTIAAVPHSYLKYILADSAALTHAFWRETLIQAAIYREWVENLGSRQALPRLAHLVCEIAARLEIVGLLDDDRFHVPFTQQDVADACGLSVVHVNRMIQELRRRKLIEWEDQTIELRDRDQLEALADFRPSYLLR
ncbi:Crp/Fnr family transcriptional regulator [Bradyrhizobium sp. CB1650]|uniref:Crp/Fnr family transcriptional regulator n=1 Tax=Bradyrhizobium sp. CB1650 TaxID=3039153 RepID=UPI002434E6DA|nr:Crp/Fnr family transcriptional regulator [Bradyrhizobium sp. CB1650]WGD50043.1 Crp/Fnr family transcriptional regulator [Bradyrhizobium sp. CB1650]